MIRKIVVILLLVSFTAAAQKQKPKTKPQPKADSTGMAAEPKLSPIDSLEATLPNEVVLDANGKKIFYPEVKRRNDSLRKALRESLRRPFRTFWVRTRYPAKGSNAPIQLCMNIINKDTNLVYCVRDSVCKDPEVSKVLYEKVVGDTTFMLIYVDAYSKSVNDGGLCSSGHETKLFFTRWNTKTNTAKWKFKNIRSCLKGITLMGKDPFASWDKTSPVNVKYHRADFFYEIKFDPARPELGIQSVKDEEPKKEEAKTGE